MSRPFARERARLARLREAAERLAAVPDAELAQFKALSDGLDGDDPAELVRLYQEAVKATAGVRA